MKNIRRKFDINLYFLMLQNIFKNIDYLLYIVYYILFTFMLHIFSQIFLLFTLIRIVVI